MDQHAREQPVGVLLAAVDFEPGVPQLRDQAGGGSRREFGLGEVVGEPMGLGDECLEARDRGLDERQWGGGPGGGICRPPNVTLVCAVHQAGAGTAAGTS